jgi:hypothetical protein
LIVSTGLSGCQCWAITEHYLDLVDCCASHEGCCERWYHPCLDVNRIGRPDWRACACNCWWCPGGCERCKPTACPIDTSAAYYAGPIHAPADSQWHEEEDSPADAQEPQPAPAEETMKQPETEQLETEQPGPTLPREQEGELQPQARRATYRTLFR